MVGRGEKHFVALVLAIQESRAQNCKRTTWMSCCRRRRIRGLMSAVQMLVTREKHHWPVLEIQLEPVCSATTTKMVLLSSAVYYTSKREWLIHAKAN